MAYRVRKHLPLLKLLKKAKPKLRKKLLASADKELLHFFTEAAHNVLKGNVKLSPGQKKALSRHKKPIRALAQRRLSLKKKRQVLLQKGGFLPALLGPIIGIVTSLIGNLVR